MDDFMTFTEIESDEAETAKYDTVGKQREYPSEYLEYGDKKLEVYHEELGTLWRVRFTTGGQLPAELTGSYTDAQSAVKAVESYLARNG